MTACRPALHSAPRAALTLLAAALLVGPLAACRRQAETPQESTFTVTRGPLDITVVETGNLEAAESIDISSDVPHVLKILDIVEEGSTITEEDVEKGRVIVRFDSSALEDQLYQLESDLESTRASFTDATEQLTIQQSDNESNIRGAELNVTYAGNDLRRLVGDTLAEKVMASPPEDIAALLDDTALGGQTREDLRSRRSDIELTKIKLSRAEEKLKYTRRLFEKQYVSKNELETDELDVRTQQLNVESAEEKLQIYRRYDFVRDFQKSWAALLEGQEKLLRAQAVARSRRAQAEAQLRSRESAFKRAKSRLDEHRQNIEKCVIRATHPGFVIYQEPARWENKGPIREGSEIRPKQRIIMLPNLNRMAVIIRVHEAQIDAILEKQSAVIRIDAVAGRTFTGIVDKKGVIPSSQDRWLNPDLKVYEVKVLIQEQDVALRPGLTATVEILSERLESVLQVPIQSVRTDDDGKHWVYRPDGTPVPVTIGKRNRIFIAIEEGLAEGEVIRMAVPALGEQTQRPANGKEPGRS